MHDPVVLKLTFLAIAVVKTLRVMSFGQKCMY